MLENDSPPKAILDRLEPGEELVWFDRPRLGSLLTELVATIVKGVFVFAFGLFWFAMAIYFVSSIVSQSIGPDGPYSAKIISDFIGFFPIIVHFAIFAVVILNLRLIIEVFGDLRTVYALTHHRLLIVRNHTRPQARSFFPKSINTLTSIGGQHVGHVAINQTKTDYGAFERLSTLIGIAEPRRVEAVLARTLAVRDDKLDEEVA